MRSPPNVPKSRKAILISSEIGCVSPIAFGLLKAPPAFSMMLHEAGSRSNAPSILKADNSHVTPIICEICRGHAHLTDCTPCTINVDVREIWTFRCETCGEDLKRVVEK